jgi:hypothetical protein
MTRGLLATVFDKRQQQCRQLRRQKARQKPQSGAALRRADPAYL